MKPERVVAACLSVLAAGLVALLLFGPTESAEAGEEARAAATTTAREPVTTAENETEPVTTTDAEPVTTTEPEPPAPPPEDSPFPEPVTITLAFRSELDWRRQELPEEVPDLRIEASASATRGKAGDVHGIECTIDRLATYTFLVDPWSNTYLLQRTTGSIFEDLERGEAPTLVAPPRPNVLSMTCQSAENGTTLSLRVNGLPIAVFLDGGISGRFGEVGLTAWSPAGNHQVVFDGVVVETGR